MTFPQALKRMTTDGTAIKTTDMLGYFKRETGTDDYPIKLSFVNRSGTAVGVYLLDSSYNVASATTAASLSAELLGLMISDNWTVGTADDFEAVRAGTGKTY